MERRLIEEWIPLREINRDAAIEMAYKAVPAYIKHCKELGISSSVIKDIGRDFYDPKIRSLHPWFARRPCSTSRCLTLAAVLPEEISVEDFRRAAGLDKKAEVCIYGRYPPLLFYSDPDKELIKRLLAKHLNVSPKDLVVCDPMAGGGSIPLESLRLGLKTIAIDYNPVSYLILKGTVEYPSKYGRELSEQARREMEKLIAYAQESLGRYYPPDSEGYIVARGVKCPKCGGIIPMIRSTEISKRAYISFAFDPHGKSFKALISKLPTPNPLKSKKGRIICPYCKSEIEKKDAYKIWTQSHKEVLKDLMNGELNQNKVLSTYPLLVKQTSKGYKACSREDFELLIKASEALMRSFEDLREYLPMSEIPPENEVFLPLRKYGVTYWYELFAPRQLLALGTLIRYVQERGEELLRLGEFGAALTLYLAFGISKVADYNSVITTWKKGTIRDSIGSYARSRRITYSEWFCEAIVPYRNLPWIFEVRRKKKTEGGIYPVLEELCKRLDGETESGVIIIHGDSRHLSSLLGRELIDVINVDPPYFDVHIYSDVSEYFWQVMRLALQPFIASKILFKNSYVPNWNPLSPKVPREGEIIVREGKRSKKSRFDKEWYTSQMAVFLKESFKTLKDKGLLLLWFTHKSLEAWETIVKALYASGFVVTKIWPVTSELMTRLVSMNGGSALNRSLVIVARKASKDLLRNDLKESIKELVEDMANILSEIEASEVEAEVFLKAAAMCAITKMERLATDVNVLTRHAEQLILKVKSIYKESASKMKLIKYKKERITNKRMDEYF